MRWFKEEIPVIAGSLLSSGLPVRLLLEPVFVLLADGFEWRSGSRKAGFEQIPSQSSSSIGSGKRRFVCIGSLQPAVSMGSFNVCYYIEGSPVSKLAFPWADTLYPCGQLLLAQMIHSSSSSAGGFSYGYNPFSRFPGTSFNTAIQLSYSFKTADSFLTSCAWANTRLQQKQE